MTLQLSYIVVWTSRIWEPGLVTKTMTQLKSMVIHSNVRQSLGSRCASPGFVDALLCARVRICVLTSRRQAPDSSNSMLAQIIAIAGRRALIVGTVAIAATIGSATFRLAGADQIVIFVMAAIALASLASVVGVATEPGAPDFGHVANLSIVVAVVLLIVFVCGIPMAIRGSIGTSREHHGAMQSNWPLGVSVVVLGVAGVGAQSGRPRDEPDPEQQPSGCAAAHHRVGARQLMG